MPRLPTWRTLAPEGLEATTGNTATAGVGAPGHMSTAVLTCFASAVAFLAPTKRIAPSIVALAPAQPGDSCTLSTFSPIRHVWFSHIVSEATT